MEWQLDGLINAWNSSDLLPRLMVPLPLLRNLFRYKLPSDVFPFPPFVSGVVGDSSRHLVRRMVLLNIFLSFPLRWYSNFMFGVVRQLEFPNHLGRRWYYVLLICIYLLVVNWKLILRLLTLMFKILLLVLRFAFEKITLTLWEWCHNDLLCQCQYWKSRALEQATSWN